MNKINDTFTHLRVCVSYESYPACTPKKVLVDGNVGRSSGSMHASCDVTSRMPSLCCVLCYVMLCVCMSWLHPVLSESLSCLFTSEFAGVWNRWYSWSDVSLGHVADPTATNYDPGIPDLFPIWATKDQNYKYFKVSTAFT